MNELKTLVSQYSDFLEFKIIVLVGILLVAVAAERLYYKFRR